MAAVFKDARFRALVTVHAADLYRFAYWLTRNRAQAEDLVQETYARSWENLHTLADESAAKAWLIRILYREFARGFEKKRLETGAEEFDESNHPVTSGVEAALEMRQALERLAPLYAEPLLLQVLGGFSAAEIADQLATTETAVMQRLSRARSTLRKLTSPNTFQKAQS